MKIPKYWFKEEQETEAPGGKNFLLVCWGWSEKSIKDAQDKASARLRNAAAKIFSGTPPERYPYGRGPLREEITETLQDSLGKTLAVVTRNAYGALVLNTAQAMFMDIDLPPEKPKSFFETIKNFFCKKEPSTTLAEEQILERIEQWAGRQFGLTMRVYRTAAGFRCLVTSHLYDPASAKTQEMMQILGCDPLYIRLCKEQTSFRARLTPKPWRIRVDRPPGRWPFPNGKEEQKFRKWLESYSLASSAYSVCSLVKTLGDEKNLPEIAPVLALHDRLCCLGENRKLA